MNNLNKLFYAIIGLFLLSVFTTPLFELKVYAADVTQGITDALNSAPEGIDLSNGRFKMPTGYDREVSSEVVNATNDLDHSERVVQIVNSYQQVGGIWGDPSRNNYINTNKKQTLSMWLNMSKLFDKDDKYGDGLAFVLQNDKRGTNAIATAGNKSTMNRGESLGVWGYEHFGTTNDRNFVADNAIQNSWALEFDTYPDKYGYTTMPNDGNPTFGNGILPVNTDSLELNSKAKEQYDELSKGNGNYNSFDLGLGKHIASGFPGQTDTYKANTVKYFTSTSTIPLVGIVKLTNPLYAYYYSQNHTLSTGNMSTDEIADLLNDINSYGFAKGWHHLTITIDIPNSKISYAFNDKNVDGTKATSSRQVIGEQTIPAGTFGDIADNKIMYGFTGATGTEAMNGLVIFEQIPGFAETEVKADFKDVSRGNKDLATYKDFAYSGERLQMNYNLTYTDGSEPWQDVKSHIVLPKNVDIKPDAAGNIGTVTVGGTTENISQNDLKQDTSGNSYVEHLLPGTMNTGTTSTATYSINGIAGKVTDDTKVASTHSKFVGSNGISDVDSPTFTIKNPGLVFTPTSDLNTTVNKGQGSKIEGTVAFSNSTDPIKNDNMLIHTIINGGSDTTTVMSASSATIGQVIANISSKDLIDGTNTVEVYITQKDNSAIESNHETFTISTKDGGLSLSEHPEKAYFNTVNTTRKNQIIGRSGNWNLSVLDSRGSNNTWRLMAKSTQLKQGNTDFKGELVFKSGNDYQDLTNTDRTIATGTTNTDDPVTTDIDSTWTKDSGVLLKAEDSNKAGIYNGTIDWTLYDSI